MWFPYYAQQFDTVELNATFYKLPTAETFDRWAQTAPPGFGTGCRERAQVLAGSPTPNPRRRATMSSVAARRDTAADVMTAEP